MYSIVCMYSSRGICVGTVVTTVHTIYICMLYVVCCMLYVLCSMFYGIRNSHVSILYLTGGEGLGVFVGWLVGMFHKERTSNNI